jgi:hypothetical protein
MVNNVQSLLSMSDATALQVVGIAARSKLLIVHFADASGTGESESMSLLVLIDQ